MHATVTDDLDLVLRWRDCGESTVRFSLASSSEFTVSCRASVEGTLNYQGDATISFETMCYGHDLDRFRLELQRLDEGSAESAAFCNCGGDFKIQISPRNHFGRRVLLTEWRYRHVRRLVRDIPCEGEFVLPIGEAEDLRWTAKAIREVIRLLDVDCRGLFELPR